MVVNVVQSLLFWTFTVCENNVKVDFWVNCPFKVQIDGPFCDVPMLSISKGNVSLIPVI